MQGEAFVVVRKHDRFRKRLLAVLEQERAPDFDHFCAPPDYVSGWLRAVRKRAGGTPGPNPRACLELFLYGPPRAPDRWSEEQIACWAEVALLWVKNRFPLLVAVGMRLQDPRPSVHALAVAVNRRTRRGGLAAMASAFGCEQGKSGFALMVAIQRDYAAIVGIPRPRGRPPEFRARRRGLTAGVS